MLRKWNRRWRRLHPFVRDILKGAYQWMIVMYGFSILCYGAAPYTVHYFRTREYAEASIAIAPALLAAGIIAAVIAHAFLGTVEEEQQTSQNSHHQDRNQ